MIILADSTPDPSFNFWMLVLTAVTIVAIVAGPILAIRIERLISSADSVRQRKSEVFQTLMTTRVTTTLPDHDQGSKHDRLGVVRQTHQAGSQTVTY
jgi:hypothetical protein